MSNLYRVSVGVDGLDGSSNIGAPLPAYQPVQTSCEVGGQSSGRRREDVGNDGMFTAPPAVGDVTL